MITVVGSLNMDLVIETCRLPSPGETILGRNFRRAPGGKGANQCLAVARMGIPCAMLGAVGDDVFGEEMIANLRAAGVDVAAVIKQPHADSGTVLIVVGKNGQNQIVVAAGANETLTADLVWRRTALLRGSSAVVAQLETTLEAAMRLAREGGAITIINPAPFAADCAALLPHCDWVIPNEHEASRLSGVEVTSVTTAAEAARTIRNRFGDLSVLLTLGARGAWLDAPSFAGHVPAFTVKAIDAVGAGDTFIGAFVSRLVEAAAPQDAARFACAAAALSVTRRGAQAGIPTRAEVEEFVRRRPSSPENVAD
jgi:ribokinase